MGLLLACSGSKPSAPLAELADRVDLSGGRDDPPGVPRYGGILRWAERAEPTTLDPARAGESLQSDRIATQLFESLLTYDADLNLQPGLAEAWWVEEGGTRYRFRLRRSARFHDDACFANGRGRPVVADDVRFSFERVLAPNVGSSEAAYLERAIRGARAFVRGGRPSDAKLAGVQVVSRRELTITLEQTLAAFPHLLTRNFTAVVPREAVQRYGADFGRHPVGSGPFFLKRWLPEQRIEILRHAGYGKQDAGGRVLPFLDGAVIRFIGSPDTELLEFRAGTLDMMQSISAGAFSSIVTPDGLIQQPYRSDRVQAVTSLATELIGFNLRDPRLGDDLRLRQALNAALDREQLIRGLLPARAVAAHGLLPPADQGGTVGRPAVQDRSAAARLLGASAYRSGAAPAELELLFNASPTIEQLMVWVQSEFRKLGVAVRLTPVTFSEYLARLERGDFQLYRDQFVAEHAAPESFYGNFYGPYRAPEGINTTGFADRDYDRLFERLLSSAAGERRLELLLQLEDRIAKQVPALFLFHPIRYRLVRSNVRGLPLSRLGRLWIERSWMAGRSGADQ